jgi:hypothetical protein
VVKSEEDKQELKTVVANLTKYFHASQEIKEHTFKIQRLEHDTVLHRFKVQAGDTETPNLHFLEVDCK